MKLWVLHGTYESEMFTSIHLTEKGCALAAIADILDFLSVSDEESALQVMNECYAYRDTDGEQTEAFEWDHDKMKEMKSKDLWKIFLVTGLRHAGNACQIDHTTLMQPHRWCKHESRKFGT